jgi:holo-[acyl-carrier protein] synthase
MPILGLGIDIVELERIEVLLTRHPRRFIERICVPGECDQRQGAAQIEHVGGLFAAKEAVLKALGTGWAQGLSLRQVEIKRLASGAPTVILHGSAQVRAESLGSQRIHLSISHERRYAVALAVLES